MHRLTRFFLLIFLLQGVLSVLAGVPSAGHATAKSIIQLRNTVTVMTVFMAAALYLAMHITPRLSKRMLLPPTLWVFWNALGAFPLSLYLEEKSMFVVGILQILLAVILYSSLSERPYWPWITRERARSRPLFTFKNLVLSAGITGCFALILTALFLHAGAFTISKKTNGFVRIRPAGAFMEERRFERAGQEIRLVAMVHIAQRGFYEEIAKALPGNKSAVVLLEGVSDEGNLLKKKFGYSNIAGALGLASQSDSTFQKNAKSALAEPVAAEASPEEPKRTNTPLAYLPADVDVSVFNPVTLRFLEALGTLLGSKTLSEALVLLQDRNSPLTKDSEAELVLDDILDKRNIHLIGEIEKALPAYDTIIVPWGAMHLPVIEAQIEKWGFKETKRLQRKAFSFYKRA